MLLHHLNTGLQARNQKGQRPHKFFLPPLEKSVGHSSKLLDIVYKI